jgi:uncharacterized NAD(P)/FAD-binding protein YdhS
MDKNRTSSVAILGLGPRGLSLLERLSAFATAGQGCPSIIYLVGTGDPGAGVHTAGLSEWLLINTVVSQITVFSDASCRAAGPVVLGPTMHEWLAEQGYRRNRSGRIAQGPGEEVGPDEYVPRALLGAYLIWAFTLFVERLSRHCELRRYDASAIDIEQRDDSFRITLSTGDDINANFVFLTTGHTEHEPTADDQKTQRMVREAKTRNQDLAYHGCPYPLTRSLAHVRRKHTVAIEGFGLTAFDVIAELTEGRGGSYRQINDSGELDYVASGDEPQSILVYCRTGVPLSARAINEKGAAGYHKPLYFTYAEMQARKQALGQLDFDEHVLPLLIEEMKLVYYRKLFVEVSGREESEFARYVHEQKVSERDWDAIAELFPEARRFNWTRMLNPAAGRLYSDASEFGAWLENHLENDLHQACSGNETSPIKAACDVLRDTRDTLRSVVDFCGLTMLSHRKFLRYYAPIFNTLAVGPPKQRIAQVLALIRTGILEADFGVGPKCSLNVERGKFRIESVAYTKTNKVREADVLVVSRIQANMPLADKSPLMRSLLARGFVRPFTNGDFHPGGIDVTRDFRVVTRSGEVARGMWALGTVAEGPQYYTYILARPGVNAKVVSDAAHCVKDCLAAMASSERVFAARGLGADPDGGEVGCDDDAGDLAAGREDEPAVAAAN